MRFACCLFTAALALPAFAHDTWLVPRQPTVTTGADMVFDSTSGHRFPTLDSGPKPDRVDAAACKQAGRTLVLAPGDWSAKTLPFSTRATGPGGMLCWLELKPKELDLKPAKVDGYLKEIDAPDGVKQAWAKSPEPKRWVEVYSKHAKTIVPGKTTEAAASAPLGLALEFVPEVDLSTGVLKGPLKVRVLKKGAPLAGLAVELVGSDGQGRWTKSDAQGRLEFPAPRTGKWLLRATDLRPTDAAKGLWESQFATLAFELLPPAR